LRDKVVFLAGSSRGIGLACARAFVREGARVVIMTQTPTIRAAVHSTLAAWGSLDVGVANVGSGKGPSGWELAREDWLAALNDNLLGSVLLAAELIPHLSERRQGTLVFVSSIAGREAIPAPLPYSAAKAALESAVKGYARLLGPSGVRVNAVVPGNVLFDGGSWASKLAEDRERVRTYIHSEVPLRRFAEPEEVADAVVFLASERAGFITGACLVVDGGQTRSW
jgi:3-oxoacyl-[acyl-carrier protein] reductase